MIINHNCRIKLVPLVIYILWSGVTEIVCSGSNDLRNINTRCGWRWDFPIFLAGSVYSKEDGKIRGVD